MERLSQNVDVDCLVQSKFIFIVFMYCRNPFLDNLRLKFILSRTVYDILFLFFFVIQQLMWDSSLDEVTGQFDHCKYRPILLRTLQNAECPTPTTGRNFVPRASAYIQLSRGGYSVADWPGSDSKLAPPEKEPLPRLCPTSDP